MRKFFVLALALTLALAMSAGVAQAKGKPGGKGPKPAKTVTFLFEGTVASVDGTNGTVAVDVSEANAAAQPFVEGQVPFAVTGSTKIKLDEARATLGEIEAGDAVVVQAKAPAGATDFTARIISVQSAPVVTDPVLTDPALTETSF